MNADEIKNLVEELRRDGNSYNDGFIQDFASESDRCQKAADLIESLQQQLALSQAREKAVWKWAEIASDNTGYVLAYSGGIYCVTDPYGVVVCKFMRGQQEAESEVSDGSL